MNGACATCAKHDTCFYSSEKVIDCIRHEPKSETNYERLFGTPERAARVIVGLNNCRVVCCEECPARGACRYDGCGDDYDALLEWLKGDM